MDNQDLRRIPPRPATPPPGGVRYVAVPEAAEEPPVRQRRRIASTLLKTLFVVVLLGVVGGLVWLAVWLDSTAPTVSDDGGSGVVETSPSPLPNPLPLPREGVEPASYRLGDCFKDFDPEALRSTVVACDTGHSAQLVATFRYPAADAYPGREALAAKALEACQAARLAPAANEYTLNFQRAYPSSTSWESGDRRVDCYVTADGGNVINANVLP